MEKFNPNITKVINSATPAKSRGTKQFRAGRLARFLEKIEMRRDTIKELGLMQDLADAYVSGMNDVINAIKKEFELEK